MASSPQHQSPAHIQAGPTPPSSLRLDTETIQTEKPQTQPSADVEMANATAQSSPLDSVASPAPVNGENHGPRSPSKNRNSRIMTGAELTPLRILSSIDDNMRTDARSGERSPSTNRHSWKPSRFPVRVAQPGPTPAAPAEPKEIVTEQEITIQEAMKQNKDLAKVMKIFEDDSSMMFDKIDENEPASPTKEDDEAAAPDDTMMSTFSTFSAVPNMTMLSRLGQTPSKFPKLDPSIVESLRKRAERSPTRTAHPGLYLESDTSTTDLLMDFTDQLSGTSSKQSPMRRTNTTGNMQSTATPSRHSNLLDFDITPLPTPRSMPSITPRELESLKSAFLSEISSLKASLSGKEAEVMSLKTAVGDAEKRVGQCMEQLRDAEGVRDSLNEAKQNWEKRSREMEAVLRTVQEEMIKGRHELEESEKRREAAEIMAQEAESKMAGMRASKAYADRQASPDKSKAQLSREKEISAAVETAGLELHALYKSKHETKVAALKKSYEKRWEKKVKELEHKLVSLEDENDKLKHVRNANANRFEPDLSVIVEERREQSIKDSAQIKELRAEIEQLKAFINSVKADNAELLVLLEKERVEKGELVQLAEEMMQMQNMQPVVQQPPEEPKTRPRPQSMVALPRSPLKSPYKSPPSPTKPKTPVPKRSSMIVPKSSGLRAPGSLKKPAESKIASLGHERNRVGGSLGVLPRPAAGPSARSGIMSSIERMGSHRGRA